MGERVQVGRLELSVLRAQGAYRRHHELKQTGWWDTVSGAPMSTEFAISRFLAPFCTTDRWVLFMDCDVLVRADVLDIARIAETGDPKAVWCVQHDHQPTSDTKMDGQVQTVYPRKNWSSVMLFDRLHPANARLTLDLVNTMPGRFLHRFGWLEDHEIGAIPTWWNWLVGSDARIPQPALVHFTEGTPNLPSHENDPFADEWRSYLF